MSRVYIEGHGYHDCTEEDLKRWDSLAEKHGSSREDEARKEIKRVQRKAKKEGIEEEARQDSETVITVPEGGE